MLNVFDEITELATSVNMDLNGRTVAIRRGGLVTLNVRALVWQADVASERDPQVKTFSNFNNTPVWEVVIRKTDYVFDGQAVKPKSADQIERIVGSTLYHHEVARPGSETEVKNYDSGGLFWLIHTKLQRDEIVV